MSLNVRPARRGDGAGIAEVWPSAAAYYADLDPAHFQLSRAGGLAAKWDGQLGCDREDSLQLVAEVDGRVVGWLAARIELPEASAAAQLTREHGWTRLLVHALLVDRRWWRHGAGTALLDAAETWGRDRGARVARLDTYAHSPVSVPFYEQRMGYQRRSIIFRRTSDRRWRCRQKVSCTGDLRTERRARWPQPTAAGRCSHTVTAPYQQRSA